MTETNFSFAACKEGHFKQKFSLDRRLYEIKLKYLHHDLIVKIFQGSVYFL